MPRESKAAKKERTAEIVRRLARMYPDAKCSLDYRNPFELLVATVLSAQCTDARVNATTPDLFEAYPTPKDLAGAEMEKVEELVRPTGFFRNKAKSIVGLSEGLVHDFDSVVPTSIEELTSLPGVGRKTANVVRGVAFGEADGVVVDTHVKRISNRLGLTKHDDPEKIEQDLIGLLPREDRVIFTHRVIDHGRAVCTARKPKCEICDLSDICPSSRVD